LVRYSDIYDKLSGRRPEKRPDRTVGDADDETPSVQPTPQQEVPPEPVDAPAEPLTGRGVSDAERSVLGELTGLDLGGGMDETADPGLSEPVDVEFEAAPANEDDGMFAELDAAIEASPGTPEPPRDGPLTRTEAHVRRAVLEESHRVMREELPGMFPGAPRRMTDFESAHVAKRPDGIGVASGGPAEGLSARVVEVLNFPARWLGPVVVTGLGLAGILLLMALLVVVLVQVLSG